MWRDAAEAQQAAEALRITAQDLLKLGVVDRVIPEPKGGAHRDPDAQAAWIKEALLETLKPLLEMDGKALVADRHRNMPKSACLPAEIEEFTLPLLADNSQRQRFSFCPAGTKFVHAGGRKM